MWCQIDFPQGYQSTKYFIVLQWSVINNHILGTNWVWLDRLYPCHKILLALWVIMLNKFFWKCLISVAILLYIRSKLSLIGLIVSLLGYSPGRWEDSSSEEKLQAITSCKEISHKIRVSLNYWDFSNSEDWFQIFMMQ